MTIVEKIQTKSFLARQTLHIRLFCLASCLRWCTALSNQNFIATSATFPKASFSRLGILVRTWLDLEVPAGSIDRLDLDERGISNPSEGAGT